MVLARKNRIKVEMRESLWRGESRKGGTSERGVVLRTQREREEEQTSNRVSR